MNVQTVNRPAGAAPAAVPASSPAGGWAAPTKLRRRPALVATSIFLVTAGTLAAAFVTATVGDTSAVLAVRADVARGELITADDLAVVRISLDPALATIAADESGSVVGLRAARDLSAGGLVTAGSVTEEDIPAAGQSVVGIAVAPGQVPGRELRPGDAVRVVATPRQGDDPPLESPATIPATVVTTRTVPDTGAMVVDVSVPQDLAAGLVAAAATGRVALVLDGVRP